MANGHPGFTRFDAGNGLHMDAQPGGRSRLAFAGLQPGLFGTGAQLLDVLQRAGVDVCRNAFALSHAGIVTGWRHGRLRARSPEQAHATLRQP